MSYQLIELKIENYARLVTNGNPLYVPLGALSPNDMTTLKVSVVVGSISALGTAALSMEESMDGGLTWAALTTTTDGPITAAGTYSVWFNLNTGIPSPNVRLKVLPGAADSLYLTKAFRTFSTGDNIIPRTQIAGSGMATEATLLLIDASLDAIETDVGTIQTDVDTIKTSVGNIETDVGTIQTDVDTIKTSVGNIETDVGTIQTDVDTIKTSVGNIETDVGTIQTDVDTIKTSVGNIKTDTGNIATDVGTIQTDVDAIKGYVDGIETLLGTIDTDTGNIQTDTANIAGSVGNIETDVGTIQTDVDLIKTAVGLTNTRLGEMAAGLVVEKHDSIYPTYNATSDVYDYKLVGSIVATVTVSYVDATKAVITSIVKTLPGA
jgi:archaellum component FlaC